MTTKENKTETIQEHWKKHSYGKRTIPIFNYMCVELPYYYYHYTYSSLYCF